MRLRNSLYDAGWLRSHGAAAKVIAVGNLTVGGTGKTPVVALLAESARSAGLRTAILTRGYGRGGTHGQQSDEVRLYARLLPGIPVVVDPDRVSGAARATAGGADLLIMDDGFQHRRLRRDLDVVLADARDPFSGGHLLPRGLLREPPSSLCRASALILTRSDRASEQQLEAARGTAHRIAPDLPVLLAVHRPAALVDLAGNVELNLSVLDGARVLCFSGIGDPTTLAETVRGLGAVTVKALDFGDHHQFTGDELRDLAREAEQSGADRIVTTEKDAMRIASWEGELQLSSLRISAELVGAEDSEALGRLAGFPI